LAKESQGEASATCFLNGLDCSGYFGTYTNLMFEAVMRTVMPGKGHSLRCAARGRWLSDAARSPMLRRDSRCGQIV